MKYFKTDNCAKSYQWVVVSLSMFLGLTALPATSLAGLGNLGISSSKADQLQGGDIVPPTKNPFGYSLSDMTVATAPFLTSGNTIAPPNTPFKILSFDPDTFAVVPDGNGLKETGSKSFCVPSGTMFYVPFAYADDTPAVLGSFPTSPNKVPHYWFASSQLGGSDSITVDGKTTSIGAAYLAGPLQATLEDGDPPTEHVGYIITMGVFLTPLSTGTHIVSIMPNFDGALLAQYLGIDFLHGEFTYTVTVQ